MKTQQYLRVWGLPQPLLVFLLLGVDCSRGVPLPLPLPLLLQELLRSWDATERPFKENAEIIPLLQVTLANSAAFLRASGWVLYSLRASGLGQYQPPGTLPCSLQRTTNSCWFKQFLLGC